MSKTDKILYFLFFIAISLGISLVYPQTIAQMEATDYFVWNDDYLTMKIAELPGITALLSDYLLQFFRWQGVGMTIEAVILTLTALLLSDIPRRIGHTTYRALGLLLPVILLFVALFQIEFYLQILFMVLAIWIFFFIRQGWLKHLYLLMFCMSSLFLMPWTMAVTALLAMMAGKILQGHKIIVPGIILVAGIIWLYIEVGLLNRLVGFIPFDHRYLYSPVDGLSLWLYLSIFVLTLTMCLIPMPRRKWASRCIQGAVFIACCTDIYLICTNPVFLREEKGYQLAALAENKAWKQILETIPKNEISSNKAYATYALLAEAALGTLPDNMFNYPVIFSENLLYRNNSKDFCRNFNRQFYENIEIYDECFRQSYEFGIQCRNGASFASMRQMVKYAILTDNFPVARKYIAKLSQSPTHKTWARQWTQALESQQKRNRTQDKPKRSNTFLGAYQLGVEMKGQLEFGIQNPLIIDYALISFLLDCDLDNFLRILTTYPIYSRHQLPKAYAEAVAMIVYDTGDENIRRYVSYSPQYDLDFRKFDAQYTAQQEGREPEGETTDFSKTYWNYFVKASRITPSQP